MGVLLYEVMGLVCIMVGVFLLLVLCMIKG